MSANPIAEKGALALQLSQQGDWDHAAALYRQALNEAPQDAELLFAYGTLCGNRGELYEARRVFDALVAQDPHSARILLNAGKIYKNLGLLGEAEVFYQRALLLNDEKYMAQINFNYAHLLLAQGRWRAGFTAYEARLHLPGAMPTPWGVTPVQDILPAGKNILVWNEQGLGDALMFARFLPLLAAQGYRVSLLAQQALKKVLADVDGVATVLEPEDEPQHFDAAIAFGSLPYLLKAEPETSWQGPYLGAPPCSDKPTRKIGLVWAGNPAHVNDRNRSLSLEALAPLFDIQGIQWISLQKGRGPIPPPYSAYLQDKAPQLGDLADTAAAMAELDLVICADTAAAHLAGALDIPAWVFIPALNTDWRWGLESDRSFWYPSLRLFRQSVIGSWQSEIAQMQDQLQKLYK